jgi:hypothetical protein
VAHVPEHADAGSPVVLIAVAWNVPDVHAVQVTSDVAVPAVA